MSTKFHMTIGTLDNQWNNLDTDIQLVKSVLLYADHIKLCSTGATFAQSRDQMLTANTERKAEYFLYLTDGLETGKPADAIRDSIKKYYNLSQSNHNLTNEDLLFISRVESFLEKSWEEVIIPQVVDLAESSGWNQLLSAVDEGIVTIHSFDITSADAVISQFVNTVEQALTKEITYPLFDSLTYDLIQEVIHSGKIKVNSVREASAKHAALSKNLFERLPLFEKATIDEILDIRRELKTGLVKFRGAVADFSKEIEFAAWDKDFPMEADILFTQKIAPAIQEIDEASKANSYIWELTSKAFPTAVTISTLAPIAAAIASGGDLMVLLTAAAGLIKTTLSVRGTWMEKKRSQQIEGNKLYFYYDAKQRMRK